MTSAAIGYVILAEKLVTDDAFEPVVWYVAVVLLLLYLGGCHPGKLPFG